MGKLAESQGIGENKDSLISLGDIYKPVMTELDLVKHEMRIQLRDVILQEKIENRELVNGFFRNFFSSEGKLIRPALVLFSAKAIVDELGEITPQVIKLATAVEFLHTASLIHDDVIDGSATRRGLPTLNVQFGNKIAILLGDIFYAQFFSILINLEHGSKWFGKYIMENFYDTTRKMCFGEIYEHLIETGQREASIKNYIEMIENKTAVLFAVACESGSMICGAEKNVYKGFREYGYNLGIVFQMMDDYLDGDAPLKLHDLRRLYRRYSERAIKSLEVLRESNAKESLLKLLSFISEKLNEHDS